MIQALLDGLRPLPSAEGTITDAAEIEATYRHWRLRTLYGCFTGYAVFYFCRRNIPLALPRMAAELGYSKAALGSIESAGHIAYGIGKFVNGILADRANPRYFMALGLFLTALTNTAFGLNHTLVLLAMFWGLNGWFQSMGFPPGARLLSHWYSPSEYGRIWGIYGCSHQVGTAIISVAAGYLAGFGWRHVFFAPALAGILGAVFLHNRLRDIPSTMGLPPVELYRKDLTDKKKLEALEKPLSAREALLGYVLNDKFVWFTAFGNFFLYIARYGVNTWLPTMLKEQKGIPIATAGWLSALFEVGGVAGMLGAGWISDRLFQARRGPIMALFMFALSFSMLAFWRAENVFVFGLALTICGLLVYGPLMLVSVAVAGFAGKKAAATASGFTGFWGYMGATVSGAGVGKVVDQMGWQGGFVVLIAACLLSAFCFALTWNVKPRALEART